MGKSSDASPDILNPMRDATVRSVAAYVVSLNRPQFNELLIRLLPTDLLDQKVTEQNRADLTAAVRRLPADEGRDASFMSHLSATLHTWC